jgi:3-deoxy-D-manno-octulosonic-acid transferase
VLILDTLGELATAYSAADIVIMGGSFTRRVEGHNPLEAAAAARPILFGPHMANCRESRDALLAGGAAREVRDGSDLREALRIWLDDPALAKETGERALAVLGSLRGAAKRTAFLLANYARGVTYHE